MSSANIVFDHVHVISKDPEASVNWFVENLGGERGEGGVFKGAPQIPVKFNGATVIVRGERTGESAGDKGGLEWGTDHFAFQIAGDFQAYCEIHRRTGTIQPDDADRLHRGARWRQHRAIAEGIKTGVLPVPGGAPP
ncbi:MAG: hypothetical protein J4F48_05020 [Nitrospinae bacterium]|nr:hypothetical protein [Nitrospinota bacterium]